MVKTFLSPQDKAQYLIDNFTAVIYNAGQRDINKVAKATGNKESSESLKRSAQAALWIAACENPAESVSNTLKKAKKLFSYWIKEDYNEEVLRNRNRKGSIESYDMLPWGINTPTNQFISKYPAPDAFIEHESELEQLIKTADNLIEKEPKLKRLIGVVDKLVHEWGPHATVWALTSLRSKSGVFDAALNLGFSKEDLNDKQLLNKFRKIYSILSDIRLELEHLE